MAEVSLTIHGKTYGVACDDGQEARVRELGRYVDERMRTIAGSGAGSSETQNLVLTAIVLADEIADLREYIEQVQLTGNVEPRVEVREVMVTVPGAITEEEEEKFASTLGKLADRIDRLATRLAKAA